MAPFTATLSTALRAPTLDRELAAGARLCDNPLLQRRGVKVCSRRRRDRLAAGLERLVAQAEHPKRGGITAAVPIARSEVLDARIQLLDLADRLRCDAPVDPQGVLLTQWLLCDGASPVFTPGGPGALRAALRELSAALHPRS